MKNIDTNNTNKMNTVQTWTRDKEVSAEQLLTEGKKRTQAWMYWDRWDKVIFLLDVQQMDILTLRQLYNDLANAQVVAQSKLTELKAEIEGRSSFMVAGITELRCRIHRQRSLIARIGRFCCEAKLMVSEYNRKNPQATVNLRNVKASKLPARSEKELCDEMWMDRKKRLRQNGVAYNKLRELLGNDYDEWERQIKLQAIDTAMEEARQKGIPEQSIKAWHLIQLRAEGIEQQRKAQTSVKDLSAITSDRTGGHGDG
jgi:hypothetical protein